MPDWLFLRRCLTILALVVGAAVIWRLRDVELLMFGSVLIALLLQSAVQFVGARLRLPPVWALAASISLIAFVVAGLLAFFVVSAQSQFADLARRLPLAWGRAEQRLEDFAWGRPIVDAVNQALASSSPRLVGFLRGYAASFGLGVIDLVLVLVAGVYLAAQPLAYTAGLMRLAPEGMRPGLTRFLAGCGWFLRRWMVAQLAAMVSVGLMAAAGLWGIGVPASASLALFAALAEFIPLFGPFLAAAPALLIAFANGWESAVWVALLFFGIHLVEANLLQPWLQRRFASLPPVLSIFALVVFGAFFGLLGVVLAAPLTIVALVSVRVLYLDDEVVPRGASAGA